MALATSCPRCHTSFRVVPDQLKIRRGLVRCGNCRHVFSGIDSLRYIDEPGPAAPPRGDAGVAAAEIARLIADREAALAAPATAVPAQGLGFATSMAAPAAEQVPPAAIVSSLTTELAPPEVSAPPSSDTASASSTTDDLAADDAAANNTASDDQAASTPGADSLEGEPAPAAPESGPPSSRDPEDPWVTLPAIDPGTEILSATLRLDDGETGAVARPVPPANEPITPEPFAHPDDHASGADGTEPGAVSPLQDAPGGAQIDSVAATDGARGADPLVTEHPDTSDRGDDTSGASDASVPAQRSRRRDRASGRNLAPAAASSDSDRPREEDAVDFFAAPSRAKGFRSRSHLWAGFASVLLAVVLLAQLVIAARDWIVAWVPEVREPVAALASLAGLRVQAPRSIDSLTLESFDLHAASGPGVLEMTAILRNRASHPVRWPAMELTLTDAAGVVMARKVLMPADYLERERPAGLPARLEQSVSVSLQADELLPTGYNVKLFYP